MKYDYENVMAYAVEQAEEKAAAEAAVKAEAKGLAEGEAKGKAEGLAEKSCDIAKILLEKGMDISFICEVTGLTREAVSALRPRPLLT